MRTSSAPSHGTVVFVDFNADVASINPPPPGGLWAVDNG